MRKKNQENKFFKVCIHHTATFMLMRCQKSFEGICSHQLILYEIMKDQTTYNKLQQLNYSILEVFYIYKYNEPFHDNSWLMNDVATYLLDVT